MKKRGALFYIIDAFVAASIIAITMTIIFSSHINTPKTESAEDALNNYFSYLQDTSISNAPGTTRTTIIDEGLVASQNDNIISTIAQLVKEGNQSVAQQLVEDVNNVALEVQYGMNMTIYLNNTATIVYTRNTEREDDAKTFLKKSVLSMLRQQEKELLVNKSISTTGTAACSPATCLYVMNTATNPVTYNNTDCDTDHTGATGLEARCYSFNQTTLQPFIVEVSIWS